jgi:hypothetical protein
LICAICGVRKIGMVWTTEDGNTIAVCKECYRKKVELSAKSGEEPKGDSASGGIIA